MLATVERRRRQVSKSTDATRKSRFGQFLTPESTAAFLDRWRAGGFHFSEVEVDAFGVDQALAAHLSQTFASYGRGDLVANIRADFEEPGK